MTNVSRLDYLVFPRIAALAEAAWAPGTGRNFDEFAKKLKSIYPYTAIRGFITLIHLRIVIQSLQLLKITKTIYR
ncbi:hypothetical protein [Sphingobacterium sp. E70]|uniref:hypothetical protein n=1 Tax=Sphingobacterium sp. E70 TaxID=2853439 RepID=UPI00211C1656|nr:hypothetical protein [Sphingobacterium sp. E70]